MIILSKPSSLIKPSDLPFNMAAFWVHFFFNLPLTCMNKTMAMQLGNAIGIFEEVASDDAGFCWGSSS